VISIFLENPVLLHHHLFLPEQCMFPVETDFFSAGAKTFLSPSAAGICYDLFRSLKSGSGMQCNRIFRRRKFFRPVKIISVKAKNCCCK
jgi:hypothetical protein